MSSSSSTLAPRCPRGRSQQVAALVRRGVENAHATGAVGGRDLIRVDEGLTIGGIWKVGHAVRANALGEPQRRRLLLGAALCAQRSRWLQRLAGVDGAREHPGTHIDAEVEVARRIRIREVRDAVRSHALGELHGLLPLGGLRVTTAAGTGTGTGAGAG